jgi:hypothetical protein
MLLKWHESQLHGFAPLRDRAFYPKLEPSVPKHADKTMKLDLHFLQKRTKLEVVIEFSLSFGFR